MLYLGIDLGTSAVKLLLCDEQANILCAHSESYPIMYPKDGWSEQNPGDWWAAVKRGIGAIGMDYPLKDIAALSFGGQMHGLVALDDKHEVIRPAILWNDGRTTDQVEYLNNTVGTDILIRETGNIAYAGFTAPKILWMKDNEPENFSRISHILLPKDYLAYCFTGGFSTDYSDASGMLLLDVKNKHWSDAMLKICGIEETMMPTLYESFEPVGVVLPNVAQELGLSVDCVVAAGAGDNAAAAIGTGTMGDARCNLSIGTSGTLFISSERFVPMRQSELHSFCHADGKYHVMGCILSAASCNRWWIEDILQGSYDEDAQVIAAEADQRLGENRVFYMPYMMGERSPLNDEKVRGGLLGLSMQTDRVAIQQAIFEGVAFALRDCLEAAREQGLVVHHATITGGGAKSQVWKTILANILNLKIVEPAFQEGPALGAVFLAMWSKGVITSADDIQERLAYLSLARDGEVDQADTFVPDPTFVARYEKRYRQYSKLYPALRQFYQTLSE